jgi:hypothetical protein
VTKMPMDTCIHTRKIIKCSVLIDSYLHHVYFHAKDYFTKRQSTLTFTYLCRGGTRRYHKVLSITVQGITGYFPLLQRIKVITKLPNSENDEHTV